MMSEKIFDAIEFANKVHRGQFRKSTLIPKMVHLIRVMEMLLECDCEENVVIAGLLHDTLEDTSTTFDDLKKKFGKKVAVLVSGASEKDKSESWENRKQQTINSLKNAPIEVLLIICADKVDNLIFTRKEYKRLGERVWKRFNRGKEKQKWYFQSIARLLRDRLRNGPGKILTEKLTNEVESIFGPRINW